MISVDRAIESILEKVEPLPARPFLLDDALGLVLAEPVSALQAQPPFDNSAMDGYAVRSADFQETPFVFEVIEDIAAGQWPQKKLGPRQASKVMTGAPIPQGCDCVVMVENTLTRSQGETTWVEIRVECAKGENIRSCGEHLQAGQQVLSSGTILGPSAISLAASVGSAQLMCVPRAKVAVLSSGDELVEPSGQESQELPAGHIYNSNSYGVAAKARELGCEVLRLPVLPDSPREIRRALREQLEEQDVIITTAGVSMGDRDYVISSLRDLGVELSFWTVAMRPGRPLGFGIAPNGKPVLALPGNPVSSLVTFEVFCRRALLKLMGKPHGESVVKKAQCSEELSKKPGVRLYLRAQVQDGTIRTTGPQGSHLLRSLVMANALLIFSEEESQISPGQEVSYIDWNG